ncbi:MAG TPA: hypothetical protein PKC67_12350 [Kiritimatiellia bacterium]|nr:hypothetical protein [Kiritimatiellia bacterium]HMP35130.1 hypothetical protein [Kiritimatiellia bacterium]
MPIGPFESGILLLLAKNRNPESHVAGATVLHQAPDSPRTSRDIDLFHDSVTALQVAVEQDVQVLKAAGYEVGLTKAFASFQRADVTRGGHHTRIEWAVDAAFRFFPAEPDPWCGYRLSLWDTAINKVLAAAGRHAIRDYIDLLYLDEKVLSLGALVWAAAAKDAGLSPGFMLEELQRIQRYTAADYAGVQLVKPPDPVAMKKQWLGALETARRLFDEVLNDEAPYGCLFLDDRGHPQTPSRETLAVLRPHFGGVRGCWPRVVDPDR